MWRKVMFFWREKPYACPVCGWQGMLEPTTPLGDAECPECETLLAPRPWWDTWGLTLVILGIVAAVVLFVAYFGQT